MCVCDKTISVALKRAQASADCDTVNTAIALSLSLSDFSSLCFDFFDFFTHRPVPVLCTHVCVLGCVKILHCPACAEREENVLYYWEGVGLKKVLF